MRAAWAAVVGRPVSHSLSPLIYRAFSRETGRPVRHYALTLGPEGLEKALVSARRRPWTGWNVTLPLKVDILRHLDSVDEAAREIGAVNAVRFHEGRCLGYNTDLEGFLAPLDRMGFAPGVRRAAVLGAGGAARAVCAALRRRGVGALWVLGRTPEKAGALAGDFKGRWASLADREALEALAYADLVVNATSAGLDGKSCPLPEGFRLKPNALAYELVYRPRDTPFLKAARGAGARTLGGLGMLVAQAAASWRIWFGEALAEAVVEKVEAGLDKENL